MVRRGPSWGNAAFIAKRHSNIRHVFFISLIVRLSILFQMYEDDNHFHLLLFIFFAKIHYFFNFLKKSFFSCSDSACFGWDCIFFLSAREKDVILHPKTASALSLASQGARGKSGQHRVTILPNGKGRASKGARHSKCHRKQTAGQGRQG